LVGRPFETGFESDGCRYLHNDPAISIVTAAQNFFAHIGHLKRSWVQDDPAAKPW
jgi:hypothetical protein